MLAGLRHRGRRRAVAEFIRSGSGPLVDYYRDPVAVDHDAPWRAASYLVVEVESTDPDPREGEPRSVGWMCVEGGVVVTGSAQHHIIDSEADAEAGAEAHAGGPAVDVVADLLNELRGRVLVCHAAERSIGVLSTVCRRQWGLDLWPWQLVDPMQWHRDRSRRFRPGAPAPETQLPVLLDRYGLPPPTRTQEALSEAFGTALLFLAMAEQPGRNDNGGPRRLGDLLDSRSWTM